MLWYADVPLPERVGDGERYRLTQSEPGRLWALNREPLPRYVQEHGNEFAVFTTASLHAMATQFEVCAPGLERHLQHSELTRNVPVDPHLRDAEARLVGTDAGHTLAVTWRLEAHRGFACLADGGWLVGVLPLPGDVIRLVSVTPGPGFAHTPRPLAE